MNATSEPRYTRSGALDRRTKAYRESPKMSAGEIEQMIRLILPALNAAAKLVETSCARVRAFREQHPELAEMERAAMDAVAANNDAVLPMWGLLNKLEEQDPELHRAWCDYLNGKTTVQP